METVAVVLSVGDDHVDTFEQRFREAELPVWQDLQQRGLLLRASLTKMEISTVAVHGATQYLVVAVFATDEGHHAHDHHAGFEAWNKEADAYQVASAHALGGETILQLNM